MLKEKEKKTNTDTSIFTIRTPPAQQAVYRLITHTCSCARFFVMFAGAKCLLWVHRQRPGGHEGPGGQRIGHAGSAGGSIYEDAGPSEPRGDEVRR